MNLLRTPDEVADVGMRYLKTQSPPPNLMSAYGSDEASSTWASLKTKSDGAPLR